jgi:hypothetical protein
MTSPNLRTARLVLICSILLTGLTVGAQTGDCPSYVQQTLTIKLSNGTTENVAAMGLNSSANVQVYVVDTSAGDFNDDEVQDVTDAISGIAAVPLCHE